MVMSKSTLKKLFSTEEIREKVEKIKEATPGSKFVTKLVEGGEFSLMQTLFYLANTPYILEINGDTACWIKR